MSTYEPGDRVLVRASVLEYIEGVGACVELFSKTDQYPAWVRPDLLEPKGAVVLDLAFPCDVAQSLRAVEDASHGDPLRAAPIDRNRLMDLAAQIEAQTKPPRIPEPTDLFAVVEASLSGTNRARFVRADKDAPCWFAASPGWADWDDLIDPILIREGLS